MSRTSPVIGSIPPNAAVGWSQTEVGHPYQVGYQSADSSRPRRPGNGKPIAAKGGMAESVDAADLKSAGRKTVGVQVSLPPLPKTILVQPSPKLVGVRIDCDWRLLA
jgi:hypothetical protein